MAFITTRRPDTTGGGGGGGQTLSWKRDEFVETAACAAGALLLDLTETPLNVASIDVYSQFTPAATTDWTYLPGTNQIQIEFSADPATDTDSGEWNFQIQYPYAT